MALETGQGHLFDSYRSPVAVPFIAWNRLEGRARRSEFDGAMEMRVHDPLWFISRQWQFGELKAEDRGSAIKVKALIESRKVTHKGLDPDPQSMIPMTSELPLEAETESILPRLTIIQKAELGRWILGVFQKDIDNNNYAPELFQTIKENLIQAFDFHVPVLPAPEQRAQKMGDIYILANKKLTRTLGLFQGKVPDGWAIYSALKDGSFNSQVLQGYPGDTQLLLNAFVDRVEQVYYISTSPTWNDKEMSYRSSVAYASVEGGGHEVLTAPHRRDRLDWYSYDVSHSQNTDLPVSPDEEVRSEYIEVIPTPASFVGMPNKRLWTLEDTKVELSQMQSDRSEIVKQIFAEFAMVYSNNWFVLPYTTTSNSLLKVKGIVSEDVFGERTFLNGAEEHSPLVQANGWSDWGFLCNDKLLSNTDIGNNSAPLSYANDVVWIPPVTRSSKSSEPFDEIIFIRDEIDNRVWAIETRIFDSLKGGAVGDDVTLAVKSLLSTYGTLLSPSEEINYSELSYRLGSQVQDNCIPFVPVQLEDGRNFKLQRASVPRVYSHPEERIRPRTAFLRKGLLDDDTQQTPLYINEQLIPRAGLSISESYQFTRWYGGKTFLWYGRHQSIKQHQSSSGLDFDNILVNEKNGINGEWSPLKDLGEMMIGSDFEVR